MQSKRLTLAALGVALAALIALALACGAGDDAEPDQEGDSAQELTVTLTDALEIEPRELTVEAGRPVRITVDNAESKALHDFTIDDIAVSAVDLEDGSGDMDHGSAGGHDAPDVHIAVDAGDVGTIMFTPTEAGEYEIYCTVTGHADGGMVATLVVT